MEKIKQFYFIQSKTNPANAKIIAVNDISELKAFKQTNNRVKNIQEYIMDFNGFKRIFSLYNQLLKSNDVKQLNNLLSKQKKYINEFLINFIKSMGYIRYIENLPEDYFKKVGVNKKNYYLLMVNQNIPEKDKGNLFKKLENLIKVIGGFVKSLKKSFFTLAIYIMVGAGIAYMIGVKVVDNLGGINSTVREEGSNPWVMRGIILYIFALFLLGQLYYLKDKFMGLYLKIFLKIPLTREIVQNVNALKLINVYLMGQIASVNEVMAIFKSNFEFLDEFHIPYNSVSSINHLIQLLLDNEDITDYFDIKTLASLRGLEGKGIDDLRVKTDELMRALENELNEQAESLKVKISSIGTFLVGGIALLSAYSLVSLVMGMTKAIQKMQ